MQKVIRIMRSMRFAILILLLLGIGSALGTFLPQNEPAEFYIEQYGDTLGGLLYRTGMTHVFSTVWFAILVVLLCISLIVCVMARAGVIMKRIRRVGFKKTQFLLGSWLLHAGILLTIFFFALGNKTAYQSQVRGIPGETTQVENTHLTLTVDDFSIDLREDGTVQSYRTEARVLDETGVRAEDTIEVNHPITVDGYQFSQAATGYAVTANIQKQDEPLGSALLYQAEYVSADSDALVLTLLNLFPDYVQTAEGPATQSMEMNNPYVLYRAYFRGQDLGARIQPINAPVNVGEYRFIFTDAAMYTVLSVRKDAFAVWTGIGSAVLFLGIVMVFMAPQKIEEEANERNLHTN